MRLLSFVTVLTGLLVGGTCEAQDHANAPPSYGPLFSLVGDYPLGESTNRTDYESIDPVARRLYIAKMGAGKLLVFDIEQNRLVAQLDDFPKVTGVLAISDPQKVYASVPGAGLASSVLVGLGMAGLSSGHGSVAILNARTLHEITRVPGGVFPDGIVFDPKDSKIFVSDELGSAVLVIDADTNKFISRIGTGGEVGNVRYDPITGMVYAPIQSRGELVVIDPKRLAVIAHHPLTGGGHPHGLAIAPHAAIGYVACDGNDMLLIVNLATGAILGHRKLAHDPDVLAVDPDTNRLYVASESGSLSSFDIAIAGAPTSLGEVFVGKEAHAVAVDPVSHRLYFGLADVNGRTVLRVLEPKV